MFFFPHDTFVGPFIWFAARACRLFHRVDINPRVFFYKFCCSIHHLAFFLLLFHSCCLHTDAWSCVSGSMHSFWPCARCGNDWCFINEIWKYSHVRCALIHFDFCNVFVRHFYVSRLVLSSHFPSNIYWINKQTVCCCGCLFFGSIVVCYQKLINWTTMKRTFVYACRAHSIGTHSALVAVRFLRKKEKKRLLESSFVLE